jgi:hypothetical protein
VKSLKFILCLLLLVSCGQKPDGKSHLFGAKSGDKYLLIDSTGEIRLSTNYSFISSRFNNSLAYFRDKNGKYGYINLFGEEVIKPSYDDASLFNSGVATVAIEDKYGVINNLGEPVLELSHGFIPEFGEGFSYIRNGFYYAEIIDNAGNVILVYDHPQHYVWDVSESVILVHETPGPYFQYVFYLDFEGNTIFDENFTSGTPFRNGLAVVERMDGDIFIVNAQGEFLVNLSEKLDFQFYFDTSQFREGVMVIEGFNSEVGEYRFGYIDTSGELIVPPQYVSAYPSSDGFLTVGIESGKMGLLDHGNQWMVEPKWASASQAINGMVRVKESFNHDWSWYNIEDQKVVPQVDVNQV